MTTPLGITLSLDGVQKFQADGRAAAGTVDAIGVSAKQTAAALRGVPAQFTDIITSLQGGQAPLTVFLQQGGQLKDMFGGAGAAAKALGGYVVGLVNPFTIAAAAGVALAVAYKQGSAEADAYTKSIALTGNVAGTTSAQLQDMAGRIDKVVGTQAKAADVLAQFVGTGRVARTELEQFTGTAIRMERSVGVAVKDTVKEFAELGKSPVEASKQLNERYNYLTAAVYEQITALKEQGKAQEAGVVAQQAYDQAMSRVANTMEEQLGTLERGWRAVTEAAKEGWDAMLNVGRKSTLSDEMGRVRTLIANKESGLDSYRDTRAGQIVVAEIDALKQKLSVMESDERMLRRGAQAQADRTKANKEAIAAYDELFKIQEKGLTKQQQLDKALADYRKNLETTRAANPESSALDPAAIARGERAIRDQYADKAGARSALSGQNEISAIQAKIKLEDEYIARLRERGTAAEKANEGDRLAAKLQGELDEKLGIKLDARTRAQKEAELADAKTLATRQRTRAELERQAKAVEESEAAYRKFLDAIVKSGDAYGTQADQQEAANASFGRSKTAIEEAALAQQKLYLANEKAAGPWDPARISAMEYAIKQQERYVEALRGGDGKALNARADEMLRAAQELSMLYTNEAQLVGLSNLERTKTVALRQVELKYAKELADIDKLTATTDEQIIVKETARNKVLQAKRIEGEAAVAKAIQDDWTRTTDEINRSLTDALLRGFESGKGFAENLRDTLKNMFNTLVLRPIISAIINPISGAITGLISGGGGASAMGSIGGLSSLNGLVNLGTSAVRAIGGWLGLGGTAASGLGLSATAGTGLGLVGSTGSGLGLTAGGGLGLSTGSAGAGTIGAGLGTSTAAGGAGAAGTSGFGALLSNPITIGLGAIAVLSMLAGKTKGETRTGGQFGVSFDGTVTNQRRGQVYTYQGQQFDRDFSNGERNALIAGQAYRLEGDPVQNEQAIRDAVSGTASGINAFLKALGSKATLTGFSAGLETSGKGRGGVFAGGILSDGTTFGESGKGDNYSGTLYEKFSTNSPDFKTALADFTLDLKQSTIQALQSVTDIPETVKKMLKGVDAEGLSEDAANALLESINAQIVGVQNLTSSFEAMGLDKLAKMGFDAAAGLAAAAGGFDKLQGNLNTYYDNFYTAEERKANLQKQVDKQFAELGIKTPKSRDEFRRLVEQSLADADKQATNRTNLVGSISTSIAGLGKGGVTAADLGKLGFGSIDPALIGGTADPKQQERLRKFLDGVNGLGGKGLSDEAFRQSLSGLIDANAEILGIGKDAGKTAAALLGLSGAFAELNESAEDAAAAIKKQQDEAYGRFQRALSRDREAIGVQVDVLEASIGAGRSLVDMLRGSARGLLGTVDSSMQMLAAQGMVYIEDAIAGLRAGGRLADYKGLSDAVDAAVAGIDGGIYRNDAERAYDAKVLAGQLNALGDLEGISLSIEEQQLAVLNKELDRLKGLEDQAKAAVEGLTTLTGTVDHYLSELLKLFTPADPSVTGTGTGTGSGGFSIGGGGGGGGGPSKPGSGFFGAGGTEINDPATVSRLTSIRDYTYTLDFGAANKNDSARQLAREANDKGVSASEIAIARGYRVEDIEQLFADAGVYVPRFDVGTNYVPRDMLAQIHEGEAIVPKAFNPWANGYAGGVGDNAALIAEMRAIREEMAALRAAGEATAQASDQTAIVLTRVTNNGNGMITAEAPI